MIFYITGDTHGSLSRFKHYDYDMKTNKDLGIVLLGDAGFNFFLDARDTALKNAFMNRYQFTLYIVRGNHEARPQTIPTMKLAYDPEVDGEVYYEQDYPRIKYFKDFGIYTLNGYRALVIGGAYSVDKWYRLMNNSPWFADEILSETERQECFKMCEGQKFDVVLTHTCPIQWEPTDLFLSYIDQEEVDKTMEIFLEQVRHAIDYRVWLFGHYHQDRLERPYVEMFFTDTAKLKDIMRRWDDYDKEGDLPWYYMKSPNYWMGNNKIYKEYGIE